jgi:hypothetical protein
VQTVHNQDTSAHFQDTTLTPSPSTLYPYFPPLLSNPCPISWNRSPSSLHIFKLFACLPLGTLLLIHRHSILTKAKTCKHQTPLKNRHRSSKSRALVGGYSNTSKMPCRAWSIPASTCHTGSRLAQIKGTVCEDCYALKNFYAMPNVQTTLHKRLATAADLQQWAANHIKLIPLVETSGYFRWFDSGDLQSIAMLDAIATIARALPFIKFWLPTKEHAFVAAWIRQGNVVPPNARRKPPATLPPPPSMKLLLLTLALALTTPAHGPKLRRFTVSAYCHCRVCTRRGDGITASGVRVREGTTIAAPRSIPFGTRIHIPGAGWRTVQDRLSPPLRPPPRFVFHLSQASPSMGHQNSNLHHPMTTRIHKPSPAERKIHSLVVQAHRRLPLLYPCAHCNRPNRLNLRCALQPSQLTQTIPRRPPLRRLHHHQLTISNHEHIRFRQINHPAHVRSSPLRHLFADK